MKDKSIQIKNIYYMLSYAFRVLKENNYKYIDSESFDNVYDLLSEILYRGVSYQLKQGLKKDYIENKEDLSTIKGRINFNESISLIVQKKSKLTCEYDDFSEDILLNQIIKTTIIRLIGVDSLDNKRRKQLSEIRPYFDNVMLIEPNSIQWKKITFDRNSQNYKMLVNICYFVLKNLLLSEEDGKYKLMTFTDEQMNLVFQNFVLNYYKEYIKANKINGKVEARRIKNAIDETKENVGIEFLPEMQSDITIDVDNKTLIIDTKYYGNIFSKNFGKKEYHSGNIYQIHDYVMHESYNNKERLISGMLLYAKTDEDIEKSSEVYDMGHWFYVDTLDLNNNFNNIKDQLNNKIERILLN